MPVPASARLAALQTFTSHMLRAETIEPGRVGVGDGAAIAHDIRGA